jgi:BirA family biotin operon repressor/biotin-[acetyl-CoA-carboxylase] ligase
VALIEEDRLTKFLQEAGLVSATRVSVVDAVDSTNSRLLDWDDCFTLHGRVCIAEFQTNGRGRHGRSWFAVGYQNLTLSLAWKMKQDTTELSAVSLVAGLAVCDFLEKIGVDGACLKWPNDVMSVTGKLAGILVETKSTDVGRIHVVIGIGLNVQNSSVVSAQVGQPVADLDLTIGAKLDRTVLLAKLLLQLSLALEEMNRSGFSSFSERWNKHDAYMGCAVIGKIGDKNIHGQGLGVDGSGAYRILDEQGRIHRLISSEIRLRQRDYASKSSS